MCDIEGLLVFLCIYVIKYGAPSVIEVVDRVQAKSVFVFSAVFLVYLYCCTKHLINLQYTSMCCLAK